MEEKKLTMKEARKEAREAYECGAAFEGENRKEFIAAYIEAIRSEGRLAD